MVTDDLPDLAAEPRALRVCKKPIPVQVEFATFEGTCETLEGSVRFRAGDAILTGVKGERWPVGREAFLSSYEAVPPTRTGSNGAIARARHRPMRCGWTSGGMCRSAGRMTRFTASPATGCCNMPMVPAACLRDQIFRESYDPAPGETRWPPPA